MVAFCSACSSFVTRHSSFCDPARCSSRGPSSPSPCRKPFRFPIRTRCRARCPLSPPKPSAVKTPDDDLFEYATLCYTQKEFQIAIKPFTEYTRLYSKGPHAAEAWFRLGECYLKTEQNEDARRAYSEVVSRFPRSESAASANYRLGAFAYNAREFARAATYFEACEKLTTDALVKLASIYNKALSLKQAGQKRGALRGLQGGRRHQGGQSLPRQHRSAKWPPPPWRPGNKEEALDAYNGVIAGTKDDAHPGRCARQVGLDLERAGPERNRPEEFQTRHRHQGPAEGNARRGRLRSDPGPSMRRAITRRSSTPTSPIPPRCPVTSCVPSCCSWWATRTSKSRATGRPSKFT